MTVYRRGDHRSQYDAAESSFTAHNGCTWTSCANGAREASDGAFDHTGTYVHTLVANSEETNPGSAGWSLKDADLAMSRAGIPFTIGTGGWAGVKAARASGRGVLLQGDSDQFPGTGCSGQFDGDHAVYVHPETRDGLWLLGDPICSGWRWEQESVLRSYAEKLSGSNVRYGIFATPVKQLDTPVEEDHVAQLSITDQTPKTIVIAKGAKRLYEDGVPDGYVFPAEYTRFSPHGVGDKRAYYATIDGKTVVRLVVPKAVFAIPAPADVTPFSQADLDQAVAAEKARVAAIKQKLAATAADIAND